MDGCRQLLVREGDRVLHYLQYEEFRLALRSFVNTYGRHEITLCIWLRVRHMRDLKLTRVMETQWTYSSSTLIALTLAATGHDCQDVYHWFAEYTARLGTG